MAKIIRIEVRPTSSGLHLYAAGVTDCGHHASVQLKPSRGTCWHCKGPEMELAPAGVGTTCPTCGEQSFLVTYSPRPERPEDRLTQVGDDVECGTCASHIKSVEWLAALDPKVIHHARFSERWGGQYHLYRLDKTSPSNFMHVGSVPAIPAIDALLASKRIAAISPTEPA
jgi:hypothetical protein